MFLENRILCFGEQNVRYRVHKRRYWILSWLITSFTSCFSERQLGRAIAEAVSHWLPTAATRVRARVWQVGFVVDKVTSGQVFSEYFGTNFIIITIKNCKRKIEVPPIGEGPSVAPFKGAKGSKVSKLAQRNVDF
jgi:hypothetical protein